jgi:hypothetical protein
MISGISATISSADSLSDTVDLSSGVIVGIIMPAQWTGAIVTLQGSLDGEIFYDLYDGMTAREVTFNVQPSSIVAVSPDWMRCCSAIRLRSGAGGAPVAQAAERQFVVIVEKGATLEGLPSPSPA